MLNLETSRKNEIAFIGLWLVVILATLEPVSGQVFDCDCLGQGTHPVQTNCNKYVMCLRPQQGYVTAIDCPSGQVYLDDNDGGYCRQPTDAVCLKIKAPCLNRSA